MAIVNRTRWFCACSLFVLPHGCWPLGWESAQRRYPFGLQEKLLTDWLNDLRLLHICSFPTQRTKYFMLYATYYYSFHIRHTFLCAFFVRSVYGWVVLQAITHDQRIENVYSTYIVSQQQHQQQDGGKKLTDAIDKIYIKSVSLFVTLISDRLVCHRWMIVVQDEFK